MRRVLSVFLTVLGLGAGVPAPAATHWRCSLSEDAVRLWCAADPADPAPGPVAESPTPPVATVRGTRFPLDPAGVYAVELWTPPSDPEWLALLARATICYRSPGCTVSLAPLQIVPRR